MSPAYSKRAFPKSSDAKRLCKNSAALHKKSGLAPGSKAAFLFLKQGTAYIPMPLIPPMPPGIAGLPLSSSGSSETIASVVNIKPAIEAAF